MSDEEILESEELETNEDLETQEIETEEVEELEEKEEKEEKVSPEEEKKSIIAKLKETIFGEKKEDKKDKVSPELEEDVSIEFTEVARKAGWEDEKILELSQYLSNEELEKLIPLLLEKEEKKEEKEKVEEVIELDDNLKSQVELIEKKLDAKYQEKISKLEERLSVADKERSVKEQLSFQTQADKFFDSVSKDLPVFGKTSELVRFPEGTKQAGQVVPTGKAFEARNSVWQKARVFHQLGGSWEEALDDALAWYKGKYTEKDTKSKVLKELKQNEKRLSPRRSEHKTKRKYDNPAEEKLAVIDDLSRRAGID